MFDSILAEDGSLQEIACVNSAKSSSRGERKLSRGERGLFSS